MTNRERFARIVEAMARMEAAIESISVAIRSTNAVPFITSDHEILRNMDQASERARVALAELTIMARRIPLNPGR
jgi:hypothetical protein